MFNALYPTVDTTAITATAILIAVAIVIAVLTAIVAPKNEAAPVINVVSSGTNATPPVAITATIAKTAPIIITTVARSSFQCSLHHSTKPPTISTALSQKLLKPSLIFSFKLFSHSGLRYSYFL